ncbi:unnamed protein product [Kuraishia capsulata CBS 1993]|uniref:Small ribosomal subunit protein uS10m n=1 Tax=Kuraishia capsulata CBS 1993 TaxID=1382522 RepID=W6MLL1_9ASCO|nr:uncharacterized protein KUCA_T00003359001 [Kuraishia capsulata CBS 1993]CDK27381.1 unnamed protein product [Kuraishia capsulata CBS 1993]
MLGVLSIAAKRRSPFMLTCCRLNSTLRPASQSKTSKPEIAYDPKVLTEHENEPADRPMPLNVEMNYYAPLKHKVKHGDLKAEITLRCYDSRNLDFYCDFALRAAYWLNIPVTGPKPLPVKRERWTVIRAPFVHAKTKENFQRLTKSRLLRVWDTNPEVIDVWLSFLKKHSSWGVGVKAHMYVNEAVGFGDKFDTVADKSFGKGAGNALNFANHPNPAVAERVLELLNDPLIKRHLGPEIGGEKVEEKEQ